MDCQHELVLVRAIEMDNNNKMERQNKVEAGSREQRCYHVSFANWIKQLQ